jgi:hypothetical protein
VAGTLKSEAAVREHLRAFEEQGRDSFLLFPAAADPDQVDLLARAVFQEPGYRRDVERLLCAPRRPGAGRRRRAAA